MLTLIGYLVLAVVLVGALYLAGVAFLPKGEQLAPAVRDDPTWALAQGRPVSGADVDNVRLPVALRGYRFAETDHLLDVLAHEIRWRDGELARLGFRFPPDYPLPAPPPTVAPGDGSRLDAGSPPAEDGHVRDGPGDDDETVDRYAYLGDADGYGGNDQYARPVPTADHDTAHDAAPAPAAHDAAHDAGPTADEAPDDEPARADEPASGPVHPAS